MKALVRAGAPDSPGVEMADIDPPTARAGRLLIEPIAVGVTAMEPHWKPTWTNADGAPRRGPVVLGHEFAGRICEVGAGVAGFRLGQRVFGMIDAFDDGAIAERVSVAPSDITALPHRLNAHAAATLPLAGLTAWQALIEHGGLQRGQTVLVHGGAGGVGAFALQIARWAGARVITTASKGTIEFCRELGAEQVIDFERERFEDHVADVDLVFDTIGGDVQERSWGVLRHGGRMVTIAGEEEAAPDQARARALGVSATFFIVTMKPVQLTQLCDLVLAGDIVPIVDRIHSLARAELAFDRAGIHTAMGKSIVINDVE